MLDTYVPEPFDGAERFKRFCSTVDETPAKLPKPCYVVETVVPRSGLFDIVRRRTNKTVYDKSDIVAIGFTYEQAIEFRKIHLKAKADGENSNVIYYDIIPQGDLEALNPLYNPPGITKDGGTDTSARQSEVKWVN